MNSPNNLISYGMAIFLSLCIPFLSFSQTPQSQWQQERQKAAETFALLDQSDNYTETLTMADLNNLPMGLSRTISNVQYTLAVSAYRITPEYTELTVYGRVKVPQSTNGTEYKDRILFFGAQGIKFSYDGSIIGDASLILLGDVEIPINGNHTTLVLRGGMDKSTGQGLNLTSLSMDCKGFKELNVSADILFPEDLIRRVNAAGEPVTGIAPNNRPLGQVTASFQTIVRDWNDMLISLTLPRFEIVGLDGFIFDVQHAVFDFSDYRNAPGVNFPTNYPSKYLIPGNPSLWKGVYIHELSVTLPKQFSSKDSTKRISFAAHDMLFDNNGVSGLFEASNILPIDQGNAGGWRFSVDRFSIELEANQLTGAGFAGFIGLPVGENATLAYDAFISPVNEYFLKVSPTKSLQFDVFAAKAEILPNSYVELKVLDGKFLPEAMLNGSLTVAARLSSDTTSKPIAQLNGIEFRKLHLKTKAPFISIEYLGYTGEVKCMNFPLSISNIALTANNNEASLGFNAKLALGADKFSITAETRLDVVGTLAQSGGLQTWKYKTVDVSRIAIDATMAEVFNVKGGLTILHDDPVYGNGFAGDITLKLDKVLTGMKANVRAIFGNKDFRYWFVDGKIKFGTSILVFPPAVNLTGFGGGAYYRMRPDGVGSGSPTGSNYVPDGNWGLGLKAAVLFNVAKDELISGEAQFEVAFNKNGGLNFIGFFGQAKVLATIPGAGNVESFVSDKFKGIAKKEKEFTKNNEGLMDALETMKLYEPNKAALQVFEGSEKLGESGFSAAIGIQYDFTKNALHATFDLYLNMLGGMLKGTASSNRAGWAVLHIDPQEWYMHMGTPSDRLGITFNLANIVQLQTGAYFMVGDNIPGSPPPPKQVADILGMDLSKLDYMRDLNALGDGRGMAFGSSLSIATGDITFLIVYANFQAGVGFDIMLKDYGDAQCKGRSGPVGMNGWYANGQSYVYLQGEVGVKVNLLFIKKKIPILKAGAAALMQAKLPNPAWFAGYLGVKFDLLGGLVKGSVRLKITLGEECELVIPGGSPLGVKVINDISPGNGAEKVDVFSAPQVAFNMPIGKSFEMEDDHRIKSYRLKLEELSVYDSGKKLPGKVTWNGNKDAASFYSHEILPPNVNLKALARISFEEVQNGRWVTVYTGGKMAEESMEVSFTTGTAPDIIPMHNVEYAHPMVDLRFFYPRETANGYIQLKRGQSYLFAENMRYEVQLTNLNGTTLTTPLQYNNADKRIEYNMPTIINGSKYEVNLMSLSKGEGTTLENTQQHVAIRDDENEITLRDAKAGQVVRTDAGKSLLAYNFGVSRFNTFADKINNTKKDYPAWVKLTSDVVYLQYRLLNAEGFDAIELTGNENNNYTPLIKAEAVLDDAYYKEDIYPLIYKNYPIEGVSITNRDVNVLGVPPVRALPLSTKYLTEVEQGDFNNLATWLFPYLYNLPRVYQQDFNDLQTQVINKYLNNYSQYGHILEAYYPFIRQGYYKIRLRYALPGGKKGSSAEFEFYNSIK